MSDTVPITALTEATISGNGAFDVLMRAAKAHLDQELNSGRIRGPEYSTVYLGLVQSVLQTSLAFVLASEKAAREVALLDQQRLQVVAETKKSESEKGLLDQKRITELAQVSGNGVDDNSVIGRQKQLYGAQTDGFKRDAEQKAAKVFADTWSVRRTTDEGTVADDVNKLNDAAVGRAMAKLLAGVGA